jgi:ATP phosphoribosyltransferase regulatory subunit
MLAKEGTPGFQLPHGLADLFFEHAEAKVHVERLLEGTFSRWGYSRIVLPTFEYADTLATEASPRLVDEMYRFFDRDGHSMALRPDMTVSTARVVGTKLYDQVMPLRFYYVGNVFRHVETQAGHRREFTQAGVELVGAATPEADAEVVALSIAALRALDLRDFQINLGQVAYLKSILPNAEQANGVLRGLEQAIERKNPVALERCLAEMNVSEAVRRAIRAIPTLAGDEAVLDEAERLAPNAAAGEAIERLRAVYATLRLSDAAAHVILDLGEVRAMGYYTGVSFHGYAEGLGFPICSGGRYDHLVGHFGASLPAIGFALGIERVLLLNEPRVNIAPHAVMPACAHPACRALAAEARALGLRVEVDVLGRQGEALAAYARARGAGRVLACGEGEAGYRLIEGQHTREVTLGQLREEMPSWLR